MRMPCVKWTFVQIVFVIYTYFIAAQSIDQISANFDRTIFRRWNYNPIELHCPLINPSRLLWHSTQTVYKAAFGCVDGTDLYLMLPVFPDVDNITFFGLNTTHQAVCTFRLIGELIKADSLLLLLRGNDRFEVDIYASSGTSLTFNTTICKTGVVRNGSCSSLDIMGTSFTGEQVNRRLSDHFVVKYTVQARDGDSHQCMGSIDGRTHSFVVRVKSDLDECAVAAAESIQLCRTKCQNLVPGYRCAEDSYSIPCSDFKTDNWMCLQEERRFYPPSTVDLDGVGTCELAANEGHHFCPVGAMDCIDSPHGPKCRSELHTSLVESFSRPGPDNIPSSVVTPEIDLELLLRKASTDKNLTYLVQRSAPLLWKNAPKWIETFGNVTKKTVQRTSPTLFELKNEVSSESILQSIEILLNLQTQRQMAIQASNNTQPISVSGVFRSASALLNVISAFLSDHHASDLNSNIADEYNIQRNGLELRQIEINRNDSDTQNRSFVMHSSTNTSDSSAALMITIPVRKLEPFLKQLNATDSIHANASSADANFANLNSDIYIVHAPDSISLFRLRMTSKNELKDDVSCRIWDMLNEQKEEFKSQTCLTHWISERFYECRCTPTGSSTFAVGLVYIMSSKDLKSLRNFGPAITIVNYVSSVITIVALSLFLFFTRFIGVFRLDQFHIALSLLLGTLVSLFTPHVPVDFEFLCAVVAILVNYFPLCAFAWKFVLGLNTLLMIVAPRANFNEAFALQVVYIPVTICAYIGPGLVVGFWFGMARQFKSGLGLCIGPDLLGYRWPLLAPITAVVLFNLLVLITVGSAVLRNYLAIRRSRVNKSTHLLVLAQLMLTLGMPYMLIYVQIISPVFMLLILPIGIALTAVFMFLLVAVIDEENRYLLCLLLTTMCCSGHHADKYRGDGSNFVDTVKSTSLRSPDSLMVTDSDHTMNVPPTSSANLGFNGGNREYFTRSQNGFMEADIATGILGQPINDEGSDAVFVPLEVTQLPTQYYYNPQSPHHSTPVICFESLHDLVMTPLTEFNDPGRIIQTPAHLEDAKVPNFYPKLRKQFVNNISTLPNLTESYYVTKATFET